MVKSIKLISENSETDLNFVHIHDHQIEIDSSFLIKRSITIKIEFTLPIAQFRNHDCTWIGVAGKRQLSNWYAPKIIRLKNNQLVQANQHHGIWEVAGKNPSVLLWHFNPEKSSPIVQYDSTNCKHIVGSISKDAFKQPLALLIPVTGGIEMSRSKIPFTSVVCFTDHCDFDTLENLKKQRIFFEKYDIKITKGFFLNNYSKRLDTASYEMHSEELKAWHNSGHELAYHSLSQSIKSLNESFKDFEMLQPPLKDINTWIDHGFQHYNMSRYQNYDCICNDYGRQLKTKKIRFFWNYIDSGTAVTGVINQLNPRQFTLGSFYDGVKHLKLAKRIPLLIKNIVFHYYKTDNSLRIYRDIATYIKSLRRKKPLKKHFELLVNVLKLVKLVLPILLFWRYRKHDVYPLSQYAPVIFDHEISQNTFTVFQTIEMVDFKSSLSPTNLDLLIKEKGLFIAHTYFSAPMDYHHGKLFGNKYEIDTEVEHNFNYLSKKINSKEIWNPTLRQLIEQLQKLRVVTFKCNEKGEISIVDSNQLAYRDVL